MQGKAPAFRRSPLFPFIDTAPRAARPLITLGLIAVNTLVFLWMLSLPPRAMQSLLVHAALIPARYTEPELARAADTLPCVPVIDLRRRRGKVLAHRLPLRSTRCTVLDLRSSC